MTKLAAFLLAAALSAISDIAAADTALSITVTTDGNERATGDRMHITAALHTTSPLDRVVTYLILINLDENERTVVDLPDWGVEPTQILRNVPEGAQASWILPMAASGDYLIYVAAISTGATLHSAQSDIIRLAIAQRKFVNLREILPATAGVPVATLAMLLFLVWRRRRLFALS